jgi:capsular polysaccharide export protein
MPTSKKVFLFLQGPHSWFYRLLADRLESMGHRCLRIHVCFADWIFWGRTGGIHYRGSLKKWTPWLEDFLIKNGVSDIVLLGEQRGHHKAAAVLARKHKIRITVTEWGYLRPDWITFELEGMSGNSCFTKDPKEIKRIAESLPEPDFTVRYPDSFFELARNGFIADVGNWVFGFLYPGYRSHLLMNPLMLYVFTGLHRWRAARNSAGANRRVGELCEGAARQPYFVFPMQIEADYQVRAYSKYTGLESALRDVIGSFSLHAPANSRLVVKLHPMDPATRPWKRIVARIASEYGAQDRVELIDGGPFDELAKRSAGVVTINSTCGVGAIMAGVPVKTLGEALYDVPGLTCHGPLDCFWTDAESPEIDLGRAYTKAVAACIQIKGGFFTRAGLSALVEEAALRLDRDMVNLPLNKN